MKKRIFSGASVEDYAAYSRAVIDDEWAFVSGTIGLDPETKKLPEDAQAQATNCIRNIEVALREADMTLDDIVRCRVFITDVAVLDDVAKVLRAYFDKRRPANTTLIAGIPAPGAVVEIEATARRGSSQ